MDEEEGRAEVRAFDNPGGSTRASQLLEDAAASLVERVGRSCRIRVADKRFVRRIGAHTRVALTLRDVERLAAARIRWAFATGQGDLVRRDARELRQCRALWRELDLSYRVWWRWTETGRAWWLVLDSDNRTGRRLWAATGGRVHVSGLDLREGQGLEPPVRLVWGGSSSDSVYLPRGRFSQRIGFDEVGADPDSTFDVRIFEVWVAPGGNERFDCSWQVEPG